MHMTSTQEKTNIKYSCHVTIWYSALVYNTMEPMINYSFYIFACKFKQVLLYSIRRAGRMLMFLKWLLSAKHVSTPLTPVLKLYSVCVISLNFPTSASLAGAIFSQMYFTVLEEFGAAEWLKYDYYQTCWTQLRADSTLASPVPLRWCVSGLRSIRGEQPIKVLLRFTQQLKPKNAGPRAEECM